MSDPALGLKEKALPYPDVHWLSVKAALAKSPRWLGRAAMVRFRPGVKALPWLKSAAPLPECVVLQGLVTAAGAGAIVSLGYSRLCRITRAGWPGGGPAPASLEFAPADGAEFRLAEGDDLYLHRAQPHPSQRK